MKTKNINKKGNIVVGITRNGEVVLGVPRPGDILFTPEQARALGQVLIAKADEAEATPVTHA